MVRANLTGAWTTNPLRPSAATWISISFSTNKSRGKLHIALTIELEAASGTDQPSSLRFI